MMENVSRVARASLAVIGLVLTVAGCGTSGGSAGNSPASGNQASTSTGNSASSSSQSGQKKWVIDLSNTSLNNGWRLEMQSVAKAFAQTAPYNSLITFNVVNAPDTVPGQIQSVDSMIAQHVNAIIIDANSPTALNPVLEQAVKDGIVVISIDSTVTSDKVYKIDVNLEQGAYINALWLAKTLHGKGNVVVDQGIVGTSGEQQQEAGLRKAFAQFPNIHIIDEFQGQWATAPSESGMQAVLATYPKIDGVWTSGGGTGVIQAFEHAHKPLVPVTGYAFNGFLGQALKYPGLQICATTNPTYMSAVAIKEAVEILQGKKVPKNLELPLIEYESNNVQLPIQTQAIVQNKDVFPKYPAQFSLPFNPPGANITAEQVIQGM